MIISASRRTDIPAFYSRWFIERIRAGFCVVPNPFNPGQRARVDLSQENTDVIVFWTRNPRPLMPYLSELQQRGYRYYFQYTLLNNPRMFDPFCPHLAESLDSIKRLSNVIGSEKIIWRYDPIVLSNHTPVDFHLETYARIAAALEGCVHHSVISFMDRYRKTRKRLDELEKQGVHFFEQDEIDRQIETFITGLANSAGKYGISVKSCAEGQSWHEFGVEHGKCIDDEYVLEVFGIDVSHAKDPSQRQDCACVASRDIGVYNTCLHGCIYCYANKDIDSARNNYERHDPLSESLL